MAVAGAPAHVVDRPRGTLYEIAEVDQCRIWNRCAPAPQVVLVEHPGDEALRLLAPDRRRTGGADACGHARSGSARSTAQASRPRSPSRSGYRSWRTAAGPSAGAMWNAAISSSSARQFRFGPVTNSRTAIRRVPALDASSISASDANSGGSPSPAGDEVPRLPPTVPQLRIWGDPTVRAAIASPGRRSPSSSISRAYVTPAPTRRRPFSRPQSVSSGIRVRSRIARRADAVEVELDHQVRAAGDRHRISMRGL